MDTEQQTKTCTECWETKHIGEFERNKSMADGRLSKSQAIRGITYRGV